MIKSYLNNWSNNALFIALSLATTSAAQAAPMQWQLWEQDVRQPSAGVNNESGSSLEVIDNNGYYGVSCTEYVPGEEGAAVRQSQIIFSLPKSRVSQRLYREFVKRDSENYYFSSVISVNDGYESNSIFFTISSPIQDLSDAIYFTLEPYDNQSLTDFRSLIQEIRSGDEIKFQILPENEENENLYGLPLENFTLKGSSIALKNILRDCE